MSDLLMLWALTTLPGFAKAVGAAFFITGGLSAFVTMVAFGPGYKSNSKKFVFGSVFSVACFAGALFTAAVPSQQGMAIIVGGKLAIDAAKTDTGKEIGAEVVAAIRKQLQEAAK